MKKVMLLGLLIALMFFSGQPITAQADGNTDLAHAIATAPRGIPLDHVFTTDIPGSATKLLDSSTVPKSIALITPEEPNRVGAIWSRMGTGEQRNQFNLNGEMKMGFWLYFGDKGANAGEGMAFVVQNAPSKDQTLGLSGQSLGVWGKVSKGNDNTADIAKTAIQKSWALELDTHVNADVHELLGYFDGAQATRNNPHIAYASPADPNYYNRIPEAGSGGNYTLQHYHANPITHGADGNWHHLTMMWHPARQYLEYYYDDVDPVTNEQREQFNSDSFHVKRDDITAGERDLTKVFWGITGSTGPTNTSNNLVMIDHSSSLGKVTTAAHLDNDTQKQEVRTGDTVAAGDQLTYRYEFDYEPTEDEQALAPLTMTMPVPEGLAVSQGRVAYDDHTEDRIDSPQNGSIRMTWSKSLTKQRHHATVTLTGRALPAKQTTTRPAVTAEFYGDNYQTSLKAPDYRVAGGLYLQLKNLGDDVQVLKRHETATVKLRLQNGDLPLDAAEAQRYPLQVKLNGVNHALTEFNGQLTGDTYQLQIPGKALLEGENTLALQATDGEKFSNVVSISLVQSPGTLSFERVPREVAFKSGTLTGQRLQLERGHDWQLAVRDERGPQKHWRLEVALAKTFTTATDRELRGQPIVIKAGTMEQPVNPEGTTVIDKQSQSDSEVTWLEDELKKEKMDILLAVAADALRGDYQGTLQWTLTNAE